MLVLLVVTLFLLSFHHGGFIAANQKVMAMRPDLFSRPGGLNYYWPGIWFSYMALWFFCDPMFPQLFQRFFAAKSEHSIVRMMLFYPCICTVVFFSPVAIGVLGHLSFPDLAGKEADRILPMVASAVSGDLMSALVIAAGVAALMSTMDSQLLTLSSVFTRDVLPLFRSREATTSVDGRVFVICLSLAGLAFAYSPPATILQIATQAFTGLAVLFPTVFFGLYLRRVFPGAAVFSILAGEAAVVCFHLKWLPAGALLPVVWVMLISFGVYLGIHLFFCLFEEGRQQMHAPDLLLDRHVLLQIAVFILAMDFWVWGEAQPIVLGVPFWIVYFVLLSGLQTAFMVFLIRRNTACQKKSDQNLHQKPRTGGHASRRILYLV